MHFAWPCRRKSSTGPGTYVCFRARVSPDGSTFVPSSQQGGVVRDERDGLSLLLDRDGERREFSSRHGLPSPRKVGHGASRHRTFAALANRSSRANPHSAPSWDGPMDASRAISEEITDTVCTPAKLESPERTYSCLSMSGTIGCARLLGVTPRSPRAGLACHRAAA